ncbi:MAG: NTPase KAP, partial [Rhodobacteraceae bacterium]|nr:NTPase KAP [Paracoccaceae bacterium]
HHFLQSDLIDMLESLPGDRCGAWVASGWVSAIKSEEFIDRLNKLQIGWSETGSKTLKAAATAAIRTYRGIR